MPRLDVFGNVNHTERIVPRFDDPNLGRPVTIPPMGEHMTHYQGDQPAEPYPGAFEPPLKEQIFVDDLNRVKRIAEENEKWLKPSPFTPETLATAAELKQSVIDRAVKNSPPPLDDVGGLEDELFDPLDPDLAAVKALFKTTPNYVDNAVSLLNKAAKIVAGKRAEQHGPKERNHDNIAILWNAFMELKLRNTPNPMCVFNAWDVATMMELLKMARRFAGAGRTNPDNYIDGAGYCGVAGEIALNDGEVK